MNCTMFTPSINCLLFSSVLKLTLSRFMTRNITVDILKFIWDWVHGCCIVVSVSAFIVFIFKPIELMDEVRPSRCLLIVLPMMLNVWIQSTAKTEWTFLISVYNLSGYTWSISVHLWNFKTYNGSRRIRCNCVQKTQRLNLKSQKYGVLIFNTKSNRLISFLAWPFS